MQDRDPMRTAIYVLLVITCFAQAACKGSSQSDSPADAGPDADRDTDVSDAEAASGDASTDDDVPVTLERPFRSGSRLSADFYRAPGLPDAFVGLVDTESGAECEFFPTAGGTLRCLPWPVSASNGLVVAGYRDAQCEQPIYVYDTTCEMRPTVITQITGECDQEASVHALSPLSSAVPVYDFSDLGECEATNTTSEDGSLVVGAAQPLEGYVAGVRKLIPHDGELTRQVIVGEDGSVHPGEIVVKDPLLVCRAEFTDEPRNCHLVIPTYFEGTDYFTDDMCTMPAETDYAYSYAADECPAPEYLIDVEYFFENGYEEYGVRRVGARVTSPVYSSLSGSCVATREQGWSPSLFEVGERVEVPKLVGALVGGGRLAARVIRDEAGTTLGYSGGVQGSALYQDDTFGRPCGVLEQDGEHVCLPGLADAFTLVDGTNPNDAFSDADCTEALTYCNTGACEQTLWFSESSAPRCGRTQFESLWTTEEVFEGTRYKRDELGACVEDESGLMQWIRVPRALASFATVTRVTDEPSAP
jgi:hypothetical protein